jgi:hypothetical protein
MGSYLILAMVFLAPIAASVFTRTFAPNSQAAGIVAVMQSFSPFAAAFNLPLTIEGESNASACRSSLRQLGFQL